MEELLRQLNLTQYESKAYLSLLHAGTITAYKLGRLSRIPSGRIYDVTDSLISKGLAEFLPGTPRLIKAIDPRIGLKALLTHKNREWSERYAELQAAIGKLEKKEREEKVSLSQGEDVYYQNLAEIYGLAKKELLIIAGPLIPHLRDVDLITPTKLLLKKGVANKMIVPIDRDNLAMAKKLRDMGVGVRDHRLKKNLRLHIIDGKAAMITIIGGPEPDWIILKINQEESVQTIREMFLSLWAVSKEI